MDILKCNLNCNFCNFFVYFLNNIFLVKLWCSALKMSVVRFGFVGLFNSYCLWSNKIVYKMLCVDFYLLFLFLPHSLRNSWEQKVIALEQTRQFSVDFVCFVVDFLFLTNSLWHCHKLSIYKCSSRLNRKWHAVQKRPLTILRKGMIFSIHIVKQTYEKPQCKLRDY